MHNPQKIHKVYISRKVIFCSLLILLFFYTACLQAQERSGDKKLNLMSIEELMNVEFITAGKKLEKISDVPASTVFITREDIEKYGYRSVEEIIANIPGYYMTDEYYWYGTMNYGVRGFFSSGYFKNLIVMVNGVPQVDLSMESYEFNMPVKMIDRIEVVRGPMSVVYGNGAFFGAINIITNHFSESGKHNIISTFFGQDNAKKINMRFTGKDNNFSYVFNGSFYSDSGIDVPYREMTSSTGAVTQWGFPDENATTGNRLSNDLKYFNLLTEYKGLRINIHHKEVIKGRIVLFPTPAEGSFSKINFTYVSLDYRKVIFSKTTIEAKLNYHNRNLRANYNVQSADNYGPNESSSNGYKLQVDAFFHPRNDLELTVGAAQENCLDYLNMADIPQIGHSNFTVILPRGENAITNSIYSQADYSPGADLKITAGFRIDKPEQYTLRNVLAAGVTQQDPVNYVVRNKRYTKDDMIFTSRLAAVYSFNENNILKMLFGEAVQKPSVGNNTEVFFWSSVENPIQLSHSRIRTFELNYLSSFSSKYMINFSVFYNDLSSLIKQTYTSDSDGTIRPVQSNKGRMNTLGTEVTLKAVFANNFNCDLSTVYQKTNNEQEEFKGIIPGFSPEFLGYIRFYYDFPNNFSAGFSGRYTGKMRANYNPVTQSRFGRTIDPYFVCDLNFRRSGIKDHLFLNMNIANVFDREIRFPATTVTYSWADRGTFGPGRSVLFGMGWEF